MQHHAVDAVAQRVRNQVIEPHPLEDVLHRAVVALGSGVVGCVGRAGRVGPRRRALPRRGLVEQAAQFGIAAGLGAYGGNHRQAEFPRQRSGVHRKPARARQIHHVERHHARQPQPLDRQHQPQAAPQIGRIDDADHQIGALFAGSAAVQHIVRHAFVG